MDPANQKISPLYFVFDIEIDQQYGKHDAKAGDLQVQDLGSSPLCIHICSTKKNMFEHPFVGF